MADNYTPTTEEVKAGSHWAKPGPLYWDHKCLVCGEDTKGHVWQLVKGDKND